MFPLFAICSILIHVTHSGHLKSCADSNRQPGKDGARFRFWEQRIRQQPDGYHRIQGVIIFIFCS